MRLVVQLPQHLCDLLMLLLVFFLLPVLQARLVLDLSAQIAGRGVLCALHGMIAGIKLREENGLGQGIGFGGYHRDPQQGRGRGVREPYCP